MVIKENKQEKRIYLYISGSMKMGAIKRSMQLCVCVKDMQ